MGMTMESGSPKKDGARIQARVVELSKLSSVEYDRVRRAAARSLGIQVATLDREVKSKRAQATVAHELFPLPAPWPTRVNGAVLLDRIQAELERFLVLPNDASEAVTLWVMHTWCLEAFYVSPILHVHSPVKRSGKSSMMILLNAFVRRPILASNASAATIFRIVDEYEPTLLLDEADTWIRENEGLRGILDGGHTRSTAYVLRCVGDDHAPRRFSTFGAKAVSGIGRIADTLQDRSIRIPMKRKGPGDSVDELRQDRLCFDDVASQCLRWATDNMEQLRETNPSVPTALNDRAADNWRPLLAIADIAGGHWPRESRDAATALSCSASDSPAIGELLLADIRDIFNGGDGTDRLRSLDLAEGLARIEGRPWAHWKGAFQITKNQVARLLADFEIHPRTLRFGSGGADTAKGYELRQFDDAFARYLPTVNPSQSHTAENTGLTNSLAAPPV
jgi:putative DNA primase/helicase